MIEALRKLKPMKTLRRYKRMLCKMKRSMRIKSTMRKKSMTRMKSIMIVMILLRVYYSARSHVLNTSSIQHPAHPSSRSSSPNWGTKLRDQVERPSWGTQLRDQVEGPDRETKLRCASWETKLRCAHSEGQGPIELVWSSSLVEVEDKVGSVQYSWFV